MGMISGAVGVHSPPLQSPSHSSTAKPDASNNAASGSRSEKRIFEDAERVWPLSADR